MEGRCQFPGCNSHPKKNCGYCSWHDDGHRAADFYGKVARGKLAVALTEARRERPELEQELALLRAMCQRAVLIMQAFQDAESLKGEITAMGVVQGIVGSIRECISDMQKLADRITPEQVELTLNQLIAVLQRHCNTEQLKRIAHDFKVVSPRRMIECVQ